MSERALDDDYDTDDERIESDPPQYPKMLRVAAYIWITIGILLPVFAIIEMVALFVVARNNGAGDQAYTQLGSGTCRFLIVLLVGLVFLNVGRTTLSGKAKDTMGNGVGSLILASIGGVVCVALILASLVVINDGRVAVLGMIALGLGALNSIMAIALFAAGVIAIVNQVPYKEWRKGAGLTKKAKPKRDDDA